MTFPMCDSKTWSNSKSIGICLERNRNQTEIGAITDCIPQNTFDVSPMCI